jgi:hypothetical protein
MKRFLLALACSFVCVAVLAQQPKATDSFDEEIWPRDIFGVIIRHEPTPVRGWSLEWKETGITWQSAIDYQEYIITATKPGALNTYFHVSIKTGVEEDVEQSVYEVRVKHVETPEEDWRENQWNKRGEWSGKVGHSAHWVPIADDITHGSCQPNPDGFIYAPATREECFKDKDR